MNQFGSHPNHENRLLYEGPRLRAFLEAQRAGSFFDRHRFAAQESPFGAAAIIVPRWIE